MHLHISHNTDTLQVDRIGPMHQAGSDSLLTAQTFFSLLSKHLQGTTQHNTTNRDALLTQHNPITTSC